MQAVKERLSVLFNRNATISHGRRYDAVPLDPLRDDHSDDDEVDPQVLFNETFLEPPDDGTRLLRLNSWSWRR